MRSLTALCFIALLVYVAAHGHLTSPAARTGAAAAPQEAVCGGVAPLAITATWEAKSQQTIRWNIAADHGGNIYGYLIMDNKNETQANFNNMRLFGPVASNPGDNSASFAVPDVSCDECVIQWMWQSGDGPYYGCSDVKITGGSNVQAPGTQTTAPNGEKLCFGGLVRCASASTSYIHVGLLLMAIVALL